MCIWNINISYCQSNTNDFLATIEHQNEKYENYRNDPYYPMCHIWDTQCLRKFNIQTHNNFADIVCSMNKATNELLKKCYHEDRGSKNGRIKKDYKPFFQQQDTVGKTRAVRPSPDSHPYSKLRFQPSDVVEDHRYYCPKLIVGICGTYSSQKKFRAWPCHIWHSGYYRVRHNMWTKVWASISENKYVVTTILRCRWISHML